ncbi:hypothetical protein CEXT_394841 [Caerostris extrusa]|uniref:Uncharacterized protein n=1 Tax=Caerostris extrusa TaxID=172846 RepID=A0AAV4XCC6_CAEEX|nr:hypothetical protein CEXT_394841 [Caerostris extrusa]
MSTANSALSIPNLHAIRSSKTCHKTSRAAVKRDYSCGCIMEIDPQLMDSNRGGPPPSPSICEYLLHNHPLLVRRCYILMKSFRFGINLWMETDFCVTIILEEG